MLPRRQFLRSSVASVLSAATAPLPALADASDAAAASGEREYTVPLGIAMDEYPYPYPVAFLPVKAGGQELRMAYMDVPPTGTPSGQTVLLLHGKNFWSGYWQDTLSLLAHAGHRAIAVDQIGFGKSSKPDDLTYRFDLLAALTAHLLDTLGVKRAAVLGHSMGGMLAARFALRYPERTSHLILENPIGLEDYRKQGVPPRAAELLVRDEMAQTVEQIRAYRKTYFVRWYPAYERFVEVPARILLSGEFPRYARAAALTTQMIYEQPVVQDFPRLRIPTLLVIGQSDRTAIGRDRISDPAIRARLGQYPLLGRAAAKAIPGARLVEIPDCGHLPHVEAPDAFHDALLRFLHA